MILGMCNSYIIMTALIHEHVLLNGRKACGLSFDFNNYSG